MRTSACFVCHFPHTLAFSAPICYNISIRINTQTSFYTPLCFKADNRFVQKRILSRRTTADVLSHFKGVQRRENSFMYEDIGGFGTEGSIYTRRGLI